MQAQPTGVVAGLRDRVLNYLPTFAGGLLVLALGVLIGWLAKRAVVRALVFLRLDRLGGRQAWRAAFSKGDVRSALYNVVGNVVMVLVVLVFLDNALQLWGLEVLSRLIDALLVYLPNLALVALIAVVGLFLANTLANRAEDALEEEEITYARLIGKILKGALLSVVGALALWQLDFARQIVLAAFLIAFGAIGVAFALAVGIGAAQAIRRALDGLFERKKER